jgi:hypothetical protein
MLMIKILIRPSLAHAALIALVFAAGCGVGPSPTDISPGGDGRLVLEPGEAWLECLSDGCVGIIFQSNGDVALIRMDAGRWTVTSSGTWATIGNNIRLVLDNGAGGTYQYVMSSEDYLVIYFDKDRRRFVRTGDVTVTG